jgi:hypothetical protein
MERPTAERLISSWRAADAAGITYRELDHWCRVGAIAPEVEAGGSGRARGWTVEQVEALCELARVRRQLQDAGLQVTMDGVRAIWDRLVDGQAWGVVAIAVPAVPTP